MGMEGTGSTPQQENPENLQNPEEVQVLQYIPPVETPEDIVARKERETADATRLEEIRTSLGMSSAEEKITEPLVEEITKTSIEIPTEEEIETPKVEEVEKPKKLEKEIVVDESLKRKGLDFTSSMDLMNGRLSKIDKEAEAVSPGTIGKFRTATRNLESYFQGGKLDLNEATNSFNRLTSSFTDLSLIHDKELRKITEDARKSLVGAIEGSKDSAIALRMNEQMAELKTNINRMIDKADEAAYRFRRGVR